jgi:hypothetical protein
VVLPYTLHVVRVGGDFMSLHRFFMPLLPILYLAFQEALNELMAILFRIQKRVWKWPVRVGTLLATTALIAALGVNTAEINRQVLMVWNERGIDSIGWLKKFVAKGKAIGTYLQKSYPEGTSIATTAAGAIPYYSRFTTQDFLGLNDEYIAHNLKPTLKRPGHRFIASRKFIKYWDSDIIIYHPICTRKKPKPRPGLTKKMDKLGYQWASVRVPGLKPQVWSFYIKKSYAAELPPHLLKSADHLVKRPRAKPKKAKRQKRRALKPRVSRP